jgi:hypothetical protein
MHSVFYKYSPRSFLSIWSSNREQGPIYLLLNNHQLKVPHLRIGSFKNPPFIPYCFFGTNWMELNWNATEQLVILHWEKNLNRNLNLTLKLIFKTIICCINLGWWVLYHIVKNPYLYLNFIHKIFQLTGPWSSMPPRAATLAGVSVAIGVCMLFPALVPVRYIRWPKSDHPVMHPWGGFAQVGPGCKQGSCS